MLQRNRPQTLVKTIDQPSYPHYQDYSTGDENLAGIDVSIHQGGAPPRPTLTSAWRFLARESRVRYGLSSMALFVHVETTYRVPEPLLLHFNFWHSPQPSAAGRGGFGV